MPFFIGGDITNWRLAVCGIWPFASTYGVLWLIDRVGDRVLIVRARELRDILREAVERRSAFSLYFAQGALTITADQDEMSGRVNVLLLGSGCICSDKELMSREFGISKSE